MSDEPTPTDAAQDVAENIFTEVEKLLRRLEQRKTTCEKAVVALGAAKEFTKSNTLLRDLDAWHYQADMLAKTCAEIEDIISPFYGFFREPIQPSEEPKQ